MTRKMSDGALYSAAMDPPEKLESVYRVRKSANATRYFVEVLRFGEWQPAVPGYLNGWDKVSEANSVLAGLRAAEKSDSKRN